MVEDAKSCPDINMDSVEHAHQFLTEKLGATKKKPVPLELDLHPNGNTMFVFRDEEKILVLQFSPGGEVFWAACYLKTGGKDKGEFKVNEAIPHPVELLIASFMPA